MKRTIKVLFYLKKAYNLLKTDYIYAKMIIEKV